MCSNIENGITLSMPNSSSDSPPLRRMELNALERNFGPLPKRTVGNGTNSSPECKKCNLITFGNYCGRTEKERIEEAQKRLNNLKYFLGITAHGYQNPILEAINPDSKYRDENVGKPKIESFLHLDQEEGEKVDHEKISENFRMIDVYSGLVDGKNYGRYNRLRQHKIRNTRNPNGTEKRFCIPICQGMEYGWWARDLDELNKTKWYMPRKRAPHVKGDVTRFVDEMGKHDPSFIMF